MHRRRFLSLIALVPAATSSLLAGSAGKGLVETFRQRYADLKSIDLHFSSPILSGRLEAVRGGGYRVEAAGRTLVCDGTSIWNAQHASKTVVIDRFDPRAESFSLDRIFFVLLNVYVPTELKNVRGRVVRLVPPDPSAMIIGIERVDLTLDGRGDVTRLDVTEGGATTAWKISKVKRDRSIDTTRFQYAPPSGWTVVDLR